MEYHKFFRLFLILEFGIILTTYLLAYVANLHSDQILLAKFKSMTIGLFVGLLLGILVSTMLLINPYSRKVWDIHKVAPPFLIRFAFAFSIFMLLSFLMEPNGLGTPMANMGFVLGGIFVISAYETEIRKEHVNSD